MTVIFTERLTIGVYPNCQHNWMFDEQANRRFKLAIITRDLWARIWGSLGTPLSDPTEEKN